MSMKARPCVVVSSWRSREGTKAAASSAISRKRGIVPRGCGAMRLRQKHARRKSPSRPPSIAASQSRSEAASVMSPASTAHSMPLE